MAAFHKLNLPVMKSQWLLLQTTAEYFELINQIKPETEPYCSNKKILKEFDHTAEIQYLKGLLGQSKSPIVFCHNDLQVFLFIPIFIIPNKLKRGFVLMS